jgi:hypothetical protein
MTRHLGSLGTERPQFDCDFEWFGATIRANPDVSPELELADFMKRASSIDLGEVDTDNVTPEQIAKAAGAMEAVTELIRPLVHPDDFDTFWDLAKRNRQDIQDLMNVAMQLVEVASGFPSGRPSSSSAGRSRTKQRSRVGSSPRASRAAHKRTGSPDPVATRALSLVPGRPDLQAAIVRAHESRSEHQTARSRGLVASA